MHRRKVGNSALEVSAIGLGSWLTFAQAVEKSQSARCIATALDAGITFFDTADVYGYGDAEKFLGESLRGFPRDKLVIGTKCFFPMQAGVTDRKGLSRQHIMESVENSLRNLRVEYLDLMQCHRYDHETPLGETVLALDELVRQGKILHWGVSRWTAGQVEQAIALSRESGGHGPISNQCPYSLMNQTIETDLFPSCIRTGVGVLAYSPLAQGVLTGKYSSGEPKPGSRAANLELRKGMWDFKSENLKKVDALAPIARELGVTLGQMALAWCLRDPIVASVIVGASRPEQILENIKAVEITFSENQLERIQDAMGREKT